MERRWIEVVIIGAGPYGLAAAAHLRAAGINPRVFGQTMDFWQNQMPRGMLLRSSWRASHISDPQHALTLDIFSKNHQLKPVLHVPLENFVVYGRWFQSHAVPDVDCRRVTSVEPADGGFQLQLEDGETALARRVVVAAGIAPFAQRPTQFSALPPSLATHSVEHSDLGKFAGRQVIVVGGGQSAFESAALLDECGAEVELIMRETQVRWLQRSGMLHQEPISRLLYAPSDVGPAGLSWLVAMPDTFRKLPRDMQDRIAYRCIRPAASDWLRPRTGNVRVTTGHHVIGARPKGTRAELDLDDGTTRSADHVLLATGYSVDVTRYPFLAPRLLQRLHRAGGYPILSDGFESSIPGLHFLGAPSAWSFGPVMRFVAGTPYSAPALARRVRASIL